MSRLPTRGGTAPNYDPVDPYALSTSLGHPHMPRILYGDSSSRAMHDDLLAIPGPLRAILERRVH